MTQIALMLGGNLPGTSEAMDVAVKELSRNGVGNIKCSRKMISSAEDCVPDTPDFLDMAVCGDWEGTPRELLALCQQLETAAGRPVIHSSRESRILDCDIILFGMEKICSRELIIPHPRASRRRFVLEVLSEIAPEMAFPGEGSVQELFERLLQGG